MSSEDARWPRAAHWLAASDESAEFAVVGIPAHLTSISATSAHLTPAAVRAALARYSTYHLDLDVELEDLPVVDLGDVEDPDGPEGWQRVDDALAPRRARGFTFAIGGDNSITHSVLRGLRPTLGNLGLITLDAHFDLRDGVSNGSPVRQLIDAGLDGSRAVQIGINNFSNSAEYSRRARDLGITVITRDQVADLGIANAMSMALGIAGHNEAEIFVDLDADVCDRAFVPGCPAAAPGGLTPHELRKAARIAAAHPRVIGMDVTEIDADADAPDGRTVRLAALCLLEAAAGFAKRHAF